MKNCLRIALLLTSLTFQNVAFSSPSNVLRVNNQGDIASLNPRRGVDIIARIVQSALFEGLTRIGPDNKPQLAGAQSVDINNGETRFTFTLRPMYWSNGERVTAYDFEKSWKEALAPSSTCLRPDLFYVIKNAKKVKKGALPVEAVGIFAKDAQTLVVELEHPAPYFLELLATPIFAPLHNEGEIPSRFNGPFCVKKWGYGTQLTLIKNPHYWDAPTVQLEQIDISFVDDANTALLMYEKGELDWIGYPFTLLPTDAIPTLQQGGHLQHQRIANTYWLCLNTDQFPLHSAKIRQALARAVDRKELTQNVLIGELPAKTPIPQSMHLSDPNTLFNDGNIPAAQKFFEEGLRDLSLTREEFPTLKFHYANNPGQKQIAEILQERWEKAFGITVELIEAEPNVHFANLCEKQFQIGGTLWFSLINDPIYFLDFFREKTHHYNPSSWENVYYTQLLEEANHQTDPVKRRENLRAAEGLLLEEMPIIPIYRMQSKYLKSPRVKGLFISDLGHADFKWASVDEER